MRILGYLLPLSLLFGIFSCQFSPVADPLTDSENQLLKFSSQFAEELNMSLSVTWEDIQDYIRYKGLTSESEVIVENIIPVKDSNEVILLYIINYDEGWDLIAADKRASVPLGWCSEGHLDITDNDCPLFSWIGCIAEDISLIRGLDSYKASNQQLVEFNIGFWKAITSDPSLFLELLGECGSVEQTRDPSFPFVPYPNGHYELDAVYSTVVPYDSIPHLTQTWWSQSSNGCNYYIPYKTDYSERAPAGCTNIAGAQMLYYLHQTIGVPTEAPTTAYCTGNVSNWQMGQDDFSTTAWSQMTSWGGTAAAILIASVALNTPTHFGDSGSTASISNLAANTLLPVYHISATYSSYDDAIVQNSLLSGMPVIVTAFPAYLAFIGHTFLIDGYYRNRTQYTFSYIWVWDDGDPNAPHPKVPAYTEINYSSPVLVAYEMNWGGEDFYYYSHHYHFAPSGDWMPQSPPDNYVYHRTMLYGFESTL